MIVENTPPRTISRILGILVICGMIGSLGACGRKGSPDYPGDSTYPNIYPYDAEEHRIRQEKIKEEKLRQEKKKNRL